jgi:hypothetical protein
MPETKSNSHGIVVTNGSLNFDGTDASLYPQLMRRIHASYNESKIPLPKSTDTELTYQIENQWLYAEKPAEQQVLQDPLSAALTNAGMKAGMLSLSLKNFRAWSNAQDLKNISLGQGCSLIMKEIKKGSQAEVLLTPAYEDKNVIKMFEILLTHYRSMTLPVLYSLVKRERITMKNLIGKVSPLEIDSAATKAQFDFNDVIDANVRGERTEEEFNKRLARAYEVYMWINRMINIEEQSVQPVETARFVANHIR